MTVHLIKMAAGIKSLNELRARQDFIIDNQAASGSPKKLIHKTRFMPKRADEVLKNGSLFWVFNKAIMVRQKILALTEIKAQSGGTRCGIVLDRTLVQVVPQPFRAFQGWRYLEVEDAPQDISAFLKGSQTLVDPEMPIEMRLALRELCLI